MWTCKDGCRLKPVRSAESRRFSGYATTNRGERVAFSILSNNFNLPDKRINETIDNIVDEILDDGKAKEIS